MEEHKLTDKERRFIARWDRFCTEQSGVYPAAIAALKLGISHAGVYQASERGWIAFFKVGRDRWYSRKDVSRYLEHRSMKKNMVALRSKTPKDCSSDDDGGASRGFTFLEK